MDPEQVKKLQRELEEAQETLRAIRQGEIDGLVVEGPHGPQVFTLKTAEQPYRMLIEQMQEGALTLTPLGDVLYCNRRFGELVAAAPETIVGRPFAPFVAEADRSLLAAALHAGRGKYEGHALTSDGRSVPALFSVGTFVADGVESLCLVVTDLIELTRTRAARAEAEAASQAKDQFLAMLGHELRNPLGAITSAVSVLGQAETPEHDRRARDVIAHQAEHLSRLVGDLLDVTRGALGKIELVRAPIDMAAAVRRCLATLESTKKLRHHVVSVDAEPVWVDADGARIEQIITNLLSNSLKFTPQGGAITVTVCREQANAVLRVADQGAGISAELLPCVFDLFVQGDRNLDRRLGGLGVGLSLVRRLVELHGGRVEATSDGPGRGSIFTVRLPALIEAPRPPRESSGAPAATPRKRILVVEDNIDNREMMRILLETSGHEVHDAGDGVSGVELAVQLEPDTVLIDIGLPGIDGYEVARQIRAKLRDRSRLIALSGYGQQKDRERAFDAGFHDHLLKPVDPARLVEVLAAARGATR
jgi:signal transduction histidine kinase/ActR/RegA family two-component response regulator